MIFFFFFSFTFFTSLSSVWFFYFFRCTSGSARARLFTYTLNRITFRTFKLNRHRWMWIKSSAKYSIQQNHFIFKFYSTHNCECELWNRYSSISLAPHQVIKRLKFHLNSNTMCEIRRRRRISRRGRNKSSNVQPFQNHHVYGVKFVVWTRSPRLRYRISARDRVSGVRESICAFAILRRLFKKKKREQWTSNLLNSHKICIRISPPREQSESHS